MRREENIVTDGREFFAAANSGNGFFSFYDKIFGREEIERRYLIKGGPGTGKSTFMRKIADTALKSGVEVERYRCSSDPASLDGIIIGGRVAVIDSTAPHAEECELAGARDILLDLGAFWDTDGLYFERDRIKALTEKKKRAYSLAYRFLSSAMQSDMASRALVIPYVNTERIRKIANRLTKGIVGDGGYECRIGLSSAIGMKGRCRLDTYEAFAERRVYIEEHYGIGYLVLCAIADVARNRGCRISISYEPLAPEIPNLVLFEESKTLFAICEPRKKGSVSIRRALDIGALSKRQKNELKSKSRYARRISEALISAATNELRGAGDAHFELEKIYRENMDFSALDGYTEKIIKEIIDFVKG